MRRGSLGCLLLLGAVGCADKGDDNAVTQDNGNATAEDARVVEPVQQDASAPADAGMDAAPSQMIDAALPVLDASITASDAAADAAPDAAVDRCLGKAEHVGDVHIFNDYDLAEAQCYETIQGSLTIENSALWALPLPKLRQVQSDLEIVYTAKAGATTLCGGTSANQVRSVSLPALTKVGRDLSLTIARNGTDGDASLRVDFGLGNLKSVGGDVTVSSNAGDLHGCGLDADELQGDVAFSIGKANALGGQMFARTLRIGGVLSVHGARAVASLFPALTEAGTLELWDLSEQAGSVAPAVALEALHVERTPRLTDIPLRADDKLMDLRLVSTGFSSLNNADGSPRFLLAPSATLTLRENSALTAAQVCAFVRAQSDAGWHGPADLDVTCP
jgi:hypothetical protein